MFYCTRQIGMPGPRTFNIVHPLNLGIAIYYLQRQRTTECFTPPKARQEGHSIRFYALTSAAAVTTLTPL
jgi:hypothetical protein